MVNHYSKFLNSPSREVSDFDMNVKAPLMEVFKGAKVRDIAKQCQLSRFVFLCLLLYCITTHVVNQRHIFRDCVQVFIVQKAV